MPGRPKKALESFGDCTEQYMAISSANIFIVEDTVYGKSLIYRMKSRGLKVKTCPDWTGDNSNEQPLIQGGVTRIHMVGRSATMVKVLT